PGESKIATAEFLILGNDGGLNITFDDGTTWVKANTPAVGQFYSVAVDMEKPYNVYGGLQDNGVWLGPSKYKYSSGWQMSGKYPYDFLLGGDGMQVAVDTTDNNTVYTGYQFGYYYRINKKDDKNDLIKPVRDLGEKSLRFNWQAPIYLSQHNPEIFYIGSNKLHRSLNKGETYEVISPDLTLGGMKGDVPYGTLTSIDESSFKFGLIYTGSDDGLVYITKDGGSSWKNISNGLPQNLWVSRIYASQFDTAVVYVSLNGYRWDNFDSYVYKSTNFGETWEKIGNDLPSEPVNVVKEDPINKNIIYVGTDNGLYASLNGGKNFMGMFNGLPFVPVHDLVVQPRDKELVVGTHGRSIYIADVQYLQQLNENILAKKLYVFEIENVKYNDSWGIKNYAWDKPSEPSLQIVYYANKNGAANIKIKDKNGDLLNELSDTTEQGLNYFDYDLSVAEKKIDSYKKFINEKIEESKKDKFKETDTKKVYLRPGKYEIEIEVDGEKKSKTFEVKPQDKKIRGSEEKIP
ncbi:MAG: glycosyl hydrolase, partial [Ignavibacteriaceae bacterium]